MAQQAALGLEDPAATEPKEPEKDDTAANEKLAGLEKQLESLKQSLESEREARIRLEEQAKAATQQPAERPPATREELQQLVDAGSITQAQMDSELAKRDREALLKEVGQQIDTRLQSHSATTKLQDMFQKYVAAYPEVQTVGSEERRRVEAEVKELVDLGHPYDLKLEVTALKNVFGPLDRVRETTRETREAHSETGSSGGSGKTRAGSKGPQIPSNLKTHYEKMIEQGQYSGWDDPKLKRELEFVPKVA